MRRPPLGLLEEFPAKEQHREHAHHGIAEQESRNVPKPGQENGVAADEGHDHGSRQGVVGAEGCPPGFVDECVAVETLDFASFFPAKEGECHDGEVDELGRGDL